MNERIRELAKQAGMWRQHYDIGEESPSNLVEFAELIVRECCQKLENDGMVEVAMELKEHFGVEE
jgi:hypothetical protein